MLIEKLVKFKDKQYKSIINPYNYKRTLCGVTNGYQLDHIISIKEGYIKKLSPNKLSNLSNLQMLPWKENLKKGMKEKFNGI